MKLLYVTSLYGSYVKSFYAERPGLAAADWATQCVAFDGDAFGWIGAWGPALAPHGIEVREVWLNLAPLQRAWLRERGVPAHTATMADIAVEQAKAFAPDVVWLDGQDGALLERIVAACPSVRATLGWVGSALPDLPLWRRLDVVLSCAPESVAALTAGGARSALLPHAFQERVLAKLDDRAPRIELSFVGQLDADAPVHAYREALLDALLAHHAVAVYSPAASERPGAAQAAVKRAAWHAARALRGLGVSDRALRAVPVLGRAAAWPGPPRGALPARLAAALQPGRFGLAMYRTLNDSRVTLNVHAGAATRFSSNMRLFEATGAGACLLTDAAENLAELFAPDREIVTFRSEAECVEKADWLLSHEAERVGVARAGRARCLAAHTFAHRAPQLVEVVRAVVR